ncbi:uncharacterized protein LOC128614222 isoform X3 [Ictalurus furcatus]|uniref:uncharacterized protein LOC128614222 isoform X3 n=1 Tax=Ictalurus furcatus TaxID=66913 RepID=UPI002350F22F|nr:uncharacterized protein LOC128614222 isoform X3 [Ictalurus furcatus]
MHSTEVNMYQRAEIHLPRKKKVREAFRSNTYRIFDENIPERLNPDEVYKDHKYASRDPEATEALKTHNIPQPYNVKFIRTNVRFLNEPIVHMETENTKDEQSKWWLNTPDKKDPRKTAYSKESTQRRDYQPITHIPVTRVREARNKTPATGINTWASSPMLNTNPDTEMDSHCKRFIFPTLGPLGQPEELVEHMSFIHQYDSRRIHDQPYQGRGHGETWSLSQGSSGIRQGTFWSGCQSITGHNHIQIPIHTLRTLWTYQSACHVCLWSGGGNRSTQRKRPAAAGIKPPTLVV